ncbi:MAG: hypothetical protein BV457_09000 [Thermoplasmata archaeon M9B1D]|nr:MAG: hypothetical protein BV457_09000 [Thermoplasmata archaeon M9B1D]
MNYICKMRGRYGRSIPITDELRISEEAIRIADDNKLSYLVVIHQFPYKSAKHSYLCRMEDRVSQWHQRLISVKARALALKYELGYLIVLKN